MADDTHEETIPAEGMLLSAADAAKAARLPVKDIMAARRYPDRLVVVTRDGQKKVIAR